MLHLEQVARNTEEAFAKAIAEKYAQIAKFLRPDAEDTTPVDQDDIARIMNIGIDFQSPSVGYNGDYRQFRTRGDRFYREQPEELQLRIAAGAALLLFGDKSAREQAATFLSQDDIVLNKLGKNQVWTDVKSPVLDAIDKLVKDNAEDAKFLVSLEVASVLAAVAGRIPPERKGVTGDRVYDALRQEVKGYVQMLRDGVEKEYCTKPQGKTILAVCDAIENPQPEKAAAGSARGR